MGLKRKKEGGKEKRRKKNVSNSSKKHCQQSEDAMLGAMNVRIDGNKSS